MKRKWMVFLTMSFILAIIIACSKQDDFPILKGPYLGQKPPGMIPEIFAPGIISNSDFLEYCLTFSSDGKEIYFNRSGAGVFVCRLKDNGWSDPEKPEFAKRYKVGEAHITPDGKRMLVNRYGGLNEGEQGGIWEFHRIKDDWGNPKFLIPFGMRATTTFDGTIYTTDVSGYKKENEDGGIIACFSLSRKGYQRNTDPGGGVNTESLDSHPFIDPKERYIIFNSDRPGGMGKSDLYVCFKNSDGSWGGAINMRELNSTEGDWCATISPDGKYLFYTSNFDHNIYWVDAKIIEELKPDEMK
jgi:hypothetical protein